MTNSNMARFGSRLIANGYAILPIAPGTKKPGRYANKAWRDYPDWTRHSTRATTDVEVETWSNWPDAGIGVVGGAIAAVDIDIAEDAALALEIETLARRMLGDTPATRIGKAPKRLLVYRTTTPFKGIKRHPLEILCVGQQFVAHAIHPETGEPYTWPEESLADLDIGALPEINEVKARAFLDEAYALLPAHLRKNSLMKPSGKDIERSHTQQGTLPAIHAALTWLPNAELDYESWIRIGLAIKGALGEDGFVLFAAWSAQAAKNDPATTLTTWSGFKPNSIGAGTIYHLAMERGWKPDGALVLDGSIETAKPHPAEKLIEKIKMEDDHLHQSVEASKPENVPPPFDLVIPDGVVGDLTHYMVETARRPQPLLSLGASLCAIGALMGRKYRTESNLRSNLYIVGVADSGSGKNHSREVINEAFVAAGLADHLGGNKIASGAGLLTSIHRQPAILYQIDEFGMFMSAAADRRRSPRHITDILDTMTELYTAAGGIFLGTEYANRDGTNGRRDIVQPCLCVYGTTTPIHFWGSLKSANVADGSLARFILLPTNDDYPDENLASGIRETPRRLIRALQLIAEGGQRASGNLVGITSGPETAVEPMIVPMTEEARESLRILSEDITENLRKARGTAFTSILARIGENATKLALIIAVGRDASKPRITGDDMEWAIGFVRHFAMLTLDSIDRFVADTLNEANIKRVLEIIKSAGKDGIRKSDLTSRSAFVTLRERNEIIAQLIESEDIESHTRKSATKSAIVYRSTNRRQSVLKSLKAKNFPNGKIRPKIPCKINGKTKS